MDKTDKVFLPAESAPRFVAVPRPQPLLEIESSNKLTETNDSTLKIPANMSRNSLPAHGSALCT